MDKIREFLKAKKSVLWWWVAFCWAAFAIGWVILIFLVLAAELDSTLLSDTTTALLGIACLSSVMGGYVFGWVEYHHWKSPRPDSTNRPHTW